MVNIDFSAHLISKEAISLDLLREDLKKLCASYGTSTRTVVECYENEDVEEPQAAPEEPKPAKKTPVKEAPAPVEEEPVKEEPKKDEIDLPDFPPRDEVSKDQLRALLRAIKDASTDNLGLRDVYANCGKEGKTFASLKAEEYADMYKEGRNVLWQLMRS